ncbi:MAG: peroxiredoxin, partial [Bacillota bacterium]|nr:peroxiredoxin [Bacillota bacterium]
APEFTAPSGDGSTVSSSALGGKKIVLYFYPKDDTSGCTAEAIDFTRLAKDFESAGAVVLGVSKDSLKKHQNFSAKYDLTIPLLSDEEGKILESYGVWIEKSMYGRKYMGIERATFLIDGKGIIRHIWHKVKVTGHAEEVLKAVKGLE